jgi:outer membrane protein assembly factor BamD (BamD/ComL family)
MAPRTGKTITTVTTAAAGHDEAEAEFFKQRKKPESAQFRLQVDRQTKRSFATQEAADAAGLAIKKAFPVLQVTVHDAAAGVTRIIELPNG